MPVILAVEPDRKQAARLASIVRHQVGAELVLADTTERALDALGARVPDMVLVPALLSPQDDASLAAALRVIAAAAHVRTLTIPVLASTSQEESRGGFLSRWRRGKAESPALDGCDPAVFAEQITAYLREAAAERIELEHAAEFDEPIVQPALVQAPVQTTAAETFSTEALFETDAPRVEPYAEHFAAESVSDELIQDDPFGTPTFIEPARAEDIYVAQPFVEERVAAEAISREPLIEESPVEDVLFQEAAVEEEIVDEAISEEPSIDLSDELVALSVEPVEENLFAGEPFGTYTLSVDEIEPEAAMLEVAAALDAPMWVEPPITIEQPVAFEPAAAAETPVAAHAEFNFDRPVAWEPPVACEAPVLFESLAMFDPPAAPERPVSIDAPVVVEPPAIVETPVAISAPVAAQAPVAERSVIREFAAPMFISSWRAWPPLEGVPIEVPGIAAAVAKPEVPDWSSLMASLREDMERRRGTERTPALKPKARAKTAKPTVDEWGFFDPEQCGFSALLAKLDEITSA